MDGNHVVVSVDAMGGDDAPKPVLEGCARALAADPDLEIILVGPDDVVTPFAEAHERCTAQVATEVIAMDEHPAEAVSKKKDSSIVVGCKLVREGAADGFFSAGSTGACMAAATLIIGRVRGISRPAIATVLPTLKGRCVMLDSGANVDCKPAYIAQFAQMGAIYARTVLGIASPRVSMLNIGSEETKGTAVAQETYKLMSETVPGFVGNCEGDDILEGRFDVIATDGFTGNVALKTIEGSIHALFHALKDVMKSSLKTKLAAAVLKPGLLKLMATMSADAVGGAPLLGVKGACLIGHGHSTEVAIENGVLATAQVARSGLVDLIAREVAGQK